MVKQKMQLSGDDTPRRNPDGSARLSEVEERIADMEARGWTLEFKSPPIETERKYFDHVAANKLGAEKKFIGSESRVTVKARMSRDYTPADGGGRHERKRSRSAI